MPIEPGRTLGERFVVEHKAATGGMGIVYRARDLRDGSAVALKVIGRSFDFDDRRFEREARVLGGLKHPGIVRYVAHGRHESDAWLAMEWLDGEDLAQRITRVGLTVDESVRVVARIAEALGSAHALGVIHRDIKPSNVFLMAGEVDRPRLLDFGIARAGPEAAAALTQSGVLLGTPGYMAPEQARGTAVDTRVDVYGLGCVLFECLTGRPAFAGNHPMALLAKIVLGDAPRVRDLRPELPAALDALVARMLAREPDDRPRDGAAVAHALSEHEALTGSVAPARASRSILTGNERRLVAAVFARITRAASGDGTLVSGSDAVEPRASSDGLSIAFESLRADLQQHGAEVEVLPRGAFVVAMHGIGPAIDLAARAARCALRIRVHLPNAAIALATGRANVQSRTTAAEPIERAARLLHDASEFIRIDDITAGLLDGRFEIGGDERGLLLRGERDVVESGRTLLGRATPCVGRERELGMLGALWEDVIDGPTARVALITAAPGMGKSRVRHELLRRLSPSEVWLSRGDAIRAGSPWAMIGDAIRRAASIHDDEAANVRERKLRARVGRHVPTDQVARVSAFLGEVTATPFADDAHPQLKVARRDPTVMTEAVRDAFLTFVSCECGAHPLMIVLEDLHWGDLPTVRLVDAALRELSGKPLMVLALARPEVHEVFPRLFAGRPLDELRLGEIPKRAAADLARNVLGAKAADEVVARIVAQAGGNAFFLEELIRAVAEGSSRTALPETMVAMVQARLEALEPDARRVLRAASIVGEAFWEGCVETLTGEGESHDVAAWLRELETRELVSRRMGSRFGDENEWAFRHALVRDAAYAMLTPEDARIGHRLAGEWLEKAGDRDAMVLAEHYERGGDKERALPWWRRAAKQAFESNDLTGAIARANRGLGCDARGDVRAGLLLVQSEACSWRDDVVSAEKHAKLAMEAVPAGTPLWWRAAGDTITFGGLAFGRTRVAETAPLIEAAPWSTKPSPAQAFGGAFATIILFNVGEHERGRTLVSRLDALADQQAPAIAGWIELARYMRSRFCAHDPALTLGHARSAAALFDRVGDRRTRMWGTIGLGWALDSIGRLDEAAEVLSATYAEAERIGLPWAISWAGIYLGRVIARQGKLHQARALLTSARERVEAGGNLLYAGLAQMEHARVELRAFFLDEAEGLARAACDKLGAFAGYRPHALATLARVRLARGAHDEAQRIVDEAVLGVGVLDEAEVALRVARIEIARALFKPARAEAKALVTELEARAATLPTELRLGYLMDVEDHARAIELASKGE